MKPDASPRSHLTSQSRVSSEKHGRFTEESTPQYGGQVVPGVPFCFSTGPSLSEKRLGSSSVAIDSPASPDLPVCGGDRVSAEQQNQKRRSSKRSIQSDDGNGTVSLYKTTVVTIGCDVTVDRGQEPEDDSVNRFQSLGVLGTGSVATLRPSENTAVP
ncbi:hypothetical protein E5288_WYG022868 [Bos mutus]|uniref:Uncharacterized protein n=1 Tax=Bos mutus TaxID=72004 RepID=A0A6B0S8M2_9CETA|nr:hypothetical protein [Bos mutus]